MRARLIERKLHALTAALALGATVQVAYLAVRRGLFEWRSQALGLGAALGAVGLLAIASAWRPSLLSRARSLLKGLAPRSPGGAWLLWAGLLAGFPLLVIGPPGRLFEPVFVRALAFWLLALTAAGLLGAAWLAQTYAFRLLATLLAGGSLYLMSTYLPGISSYPLSLGWSETSRYYYASLFLSQRVYGLSLPPSVLHPSRYMLQAVPFLIPGSQLWAHRLWQSLLWVGLPLATAALLVRRLQLEQRTTRWLAGLWAFLFLFQGPILYHLLVCVILVLWGFRSDRFWRSLLVVGAASIWAGVSRINWIPVPGFLAATIYLLERPRRSESLLHYWTPALIWILAGSLAALAAYSGYILLSGNEAAQFGSSLTSDLLWHRLLPNRTFSPGILLAIGLVTLPVAAILWRAFSGPSQRMEVARWLPGAAMLGVLLAGGVIVSLKIGGGSNLHNLDAYLILLMVVGATVYFGRAPGLEAHTGRGWGTHALLVAVPLWFALNAGGPAPTLDHAFAERVVRQIRSQIQALQVEDPNVLFISERHLITFGALNGLRLLPDYEKVFLMEMAMGGSRPYLDRFHRQLRNQSFDLIVSDPLKIQFQGRRRAFGVENDAWVREVSAPTLCYYEPLLTFDEAAVQILAPRPDPQDCPRSGGEG